MRRHTGGIKAFNRLLRMGYRPSWMIQNWIPEDHENKKLIAISVAPARCLPCRGNCSSRANPDSPGKNS